MLFTVVATVAFESVGYNLSGAFSIATFLPGFAVTSRRLQDTDRSGWRQLLYFLPIVGWIVLIIFCAMHCSRCSQQLDKELLPGEPPQKASSDVRAIRPYELRISPN